MPTGKPVNRELQFGASGASEDTKQAGRDKRPLDDNYDDDDG